MRAASRLLIACAFVAAAWAQNPVSCTAAVSTPGLRSIGVTELASVLITCTNPNSYSPGSTLPFASFVLTSNAPITSRNIGFDSNQNTWTEALLIRDDAPAGQQFFCAGSCVGQAGASFSTNNPSVFQARRLSGASLEFAGIPVDAGTRRFRIENIRLDVSTTSGTAVNLSVNASGVNIPQAGLGVGVPVFPVTLQILNAAKTTVGTVGIVTGGNVASTRVGTLRLTEQIAGALRRRSTAVPTTVDAFPAFAPQPAPGVAYVSESGFTNPSLPTITGRGAVGTAGVGETGTRIRVTFFGIPAGVTLAVGPLSDNASVNSALRLVSPTPSTGPVTLVPSGGQAVTVWEVLNADASTVDAFDLGIFAAYDSGAGSGTVSVSAGLEPRAQSEVFPTPRFIDGNVVVSALTFTAPGAVMSCTLSANPLSVRASGQAELTASGLITCSGGFPRQGTLPTMDFLLAAQQNNRAVPITSRTLGVETSDGTRVFTEALLLVDDPAPANQYPCTGFCPGLGNGSGGGTNYFGNGEGQNRNVYQGELNPDGRLVFRSIPIDPAPAGGGAPNTRRYRFENIRIDTTGLPGGPVALTVFAVQPPGDFALTNNTAVVANVVVPTPGFVMDARGTGLAPSGVEVDGSAAQPTPQRLATIRFRESFPTLFKARTLGLNPPEPQPFPGALYQSESGFYNPALPSAGQRGNLGAAGLADHGLRVWMRFSNVPAGVQVFVNSVSDEASTIARLVATDANGNGPFVPGASGVTPVATIAVFEFLRTDVELIENASFGIYLTNAAGIQQNIPVNVELSLAPFSSSAIPRFQPGTGVTLPLFTFRAKPIEPENVSLIVNPSTMLFTVFEGQTSAPQTLTASSSNPSIPLDVTIEGPGTFPTTITPSAGRTNLNASVTASAGSLPAGRYDGLIRVSAGRAINAPVLVPVTLIVQRNFVLLSITPEVVQAGGNGFRLTGVGRFVPPGSSLAWNGEVLETTGGGDTLFANIPARLYAQPGRALITIRAGDGRISNALPLEIVPRVFITRLDPERVTATRPGLNLIVTGGGYVTASQVRFGGETPAVQSGSETRLVVPLTSAQLAEPRTVPVQVLNPFNIVSNVVDFIIDPVPVITAVEPNVIAPGAPVQPVRVRGRNFRADHTLRIGGGAGTAAFVSSEEFLLTLAAPANAGVYALTVVTSDGVLSNSATLNVTRPAVVINPTFTTGDTGGPVTIEGSGFVGGTQIQIIPGCVPPVTITPTSITPTQITFTMPPAVLGCTGPVQIIIVPPPGNPAPPPIIVNINPAPRIDGVTPANLVVGVGAGVITVNGSDLPSGSVILLNGQPIPTTLVSPQQLTGMPPASFFSTPGTVRLQVQGPGGALSNTFLITIVLPPLPDASFDQVPANANSRQTVMGRARLASPFPADVAVQLVLTFAPDGNLPDDPLIRFSNGSRTLDLILRAGADPSVPFALETGSTAGIITIVMRLTPAGGSVAGGPSVRITIARRAPDLTALECRRDATARTLTITADGISNTREVRQGVFQFQTGTGASVPTTQFTIDVVTLFNTWFTSTASQTLGGVFRYTQTFNIQGDPAAVTGVTLTMANAVGSSNTSTSECR